MLKGPILKQVFIFFIYIKELNWQQNVVNLAPVREDVFFGVVGYFALYTMNNLNQDKSRLGISSFKSK